MNTIRRIWHVLQLHCKTILKKLEHILLRYLHLITGRNSITRKLLERKMKFTKWYLVFHYFYIILGRDTAIRHQITQQSIDNHHVLVVSPWRSHSSSIGWLGSGPTCGTNPINLTLQRNLKIVWQSAGTTYCGSKLPLELIVRDLKLDKCWLMVTFDSLKCVCNTSITHSDFQISFLISVLRPNPSARRSMYFRSSFSLELKRSSRFCKHAVESSIFWTSRRDYCKRARRPFP